MAFNAEHIKWFRDSSPYIDAHRGRTFVVCLCEGALDSNNLSNIISDLALLNSLGVRLVVVYGDENGIARQAGEWPANGSRRITPADVMEQAARQLGKVTFELTSQFSASRPDSPVKRKISVATGNFLKAKPLGIIDGVDHLQTGEVRRVDADGLKHQLDGRAIVMIPPLGYSPSGEVFYLETTHVASHIAQSLDADKLIFMSADEGLRNRDGDVINEIDLSRDASRLLADNAEADRLLTLCHRACRSGVDRCHIVSFETDGALLEELFTRDGCGTQVIGHSYEQVRAASIDDVPGILRLIEPLEAEGVLVKRSRELLESEIDRFFVIERDGLLISCAALYPFDNMGELACVVTHPDYRKGDRGDRLLEAVQQAATTAGMEQLFVLTTQSADWFRERGFSECELTNLPAQKQAFYNYQRNSRVLIRPV
jgi:amino-acid N-acetyltransferase